MEIILASQSPRRKEIMEGAGFSVRIIPSDVEETVDKSLSPGELVKSLAGQKARAVAAAYPDRIVLGADTMVVEGGELLGKPKDEADARDMLRRLSGRCHEVYTGFCLIKSGKAVSDYDCTKVFFKELSDAEIEAYIRSGEPMDKAGAYGIQGLGMRFIPRIEGDFYNVMGLPVVKVAEALKQFSEFDTETEF